MQSVLPLAYLVDVEPSPVLPGINDSMRVTAYEYIIFAGANVSRDTVYRITRAVAEGQEYLADSFANFRDLDPQLMAEGAYDIPYHEGAIRYYQEEGIWSQ